MMTSRSAVGILAVAVAAAAAGFGARGLLHDEDDDSDESAGARGVAASPESLQAGIAEDSARALAVAQVPGGQAGKGELERENGVLIYSFDIRVPGKSGIEELHIGAVDGKVLGRSHESDEEEARESKADTGKGRP